MIHYSIDEIQRIIIVHAVLNTFLDLEKWLNANQ